MEFEAEFDELVRAIDGMPIMSVDQGRRIWQHFLATEPRDVLDIGTCYGASAAYLAGALRQLGRGRVVTVDTSQFDEISPARGMVDELLARCGLTDWVEVVRMPHSSYAWWLLEEVRRLTPEGRPCDPAYDFVYLDGAKSLTIDTTSAMLAERLLRPGGWLLLDDLKWSYSGRPEYQPTTVLGDGNKYVMSEAEIALPHVQALVDHVVGQHPAFGEVRIDGDGQWAWLHKVSSGERRVTHEMRVSDDVTGRVLLRAAGQRAIAKARRFVSGSGVSGGGG